MALLLQRANREAFCSRFRLLLASQSPRRRELLGLLGLPFDTATPDFAEDLEKSRYTPEQYVLATATGKCAAVQAAKLERPEGDRRAVVVCADTVVTVDGRILEKPADAAAAREMLSSLSGRSHEVLTAVVVGIGDAEGTHSFVERTEVTFHSLSDEEIDAYVATGEPFDKAGGYGIQAQGSVLVQGIRGDYFNVVGLPIARLARLLASEVLPGGGGGAAASSPAKRRKTEAPFIDKLALVLVRDRRQLVARTRGKAAFFTPGGKREAGESDKEALVREIKEELSVELQPDSVQPYGVFQAQAHGKPEGTTVRLACFTADFAGTPAPSNEIEELKWIGSAFEPELLSETGRQLLADLHAKGLVD